MADGGGGMEVATQWLGAREEALAREALLRAARDFRAVHAHRDAARAGRQALELWPEGEDDRGAIEVLEDYAVSAELAGELAEAARAWREICTVQGGLGALERVAAGRRRLAAVHELRGDRDAGDRRAPGGRPGLRRRGPPAEAAIERLVVADQLRAASDHTDAIALAQAAGREAATADRARPARPRARAGGRLARHPRRVRRGARDRAGRARAGPRARPHARGGRALPAAEHRPLRLRRLPPRPGDARPRRSTCAAPATQVRPSCCASPAWSTCCASAASGRARWRSGAT